MTEQTDTQAGGLVTAGSVGPSGETAAPPRDVSPAPAARLEGWPPFVRELDATLAVHSQYVLWGNLHDSFLTPVDAGTVDTGMTDAGMTDAGTADAGTTLLPLKDHLWEALRDSGFSCLITYDVVAGVGVHPAAGPDAADAHAAAVGLVGDLPRERTASLESLRGILAAVADPATPRRAAVLIEHASRIARSPSDLEPAERDFFAFCAKLSRESRAVRLPGARPTPLYNPVIWLVERPGDLPVWLGADNDMIREIAVPRPDFGDRQQTALLLSRAFPSWADPADARVPEATGRFAEQAEGLTLQAMIEVTRLARDRGLDFGQLSDAVRTYKLGVLDNPWRRDYLRRRIAEGEERVPARVVGQGRAVVKTLDILKRAALGLTGAQSGRSATAPRGVLFFAGPTGVGKTELAKAISALVFGDESAYLRFDMSEFSSEHAGDRLIGAPPGYVGFEAGGELTNAVRQRPFRVILFDEIEKAHPRILDKFLQILEDGRLSDGRGNTAYFSESILIFTSNLGMSVEDGSGGRVPNVEPGMPYAEIERRITAAVGHHFTSVLGRPELLNRLGNSVVVFDFIGEDAASAIFGIQLDNVLRRVEEEHGMALHLDDEVRETLRAWCTADLDKGGRGISNALEANFVNPLARALFAPAEGVRDRAEIVALHRSDGVVTVVLR